MIFGTGSWAIFPKYDLPMLTCVSRTLSKPLTLPRKSIPLIRKFQKYYWSLISREPFHCVNSLFSKWVHVQKFYVTWFSHHIAELMSRVRESYYILASFLCLSNCSGRNILLICRHTSGFCLRYLKCEGLNVRTEFKSYLLDINTKPEASI